MKNQKNKIKSGIRKPAHRFVYVILLFLLLVGLPIVVYKDYKGKESERIKKEIARQGNLQNGSVDLAVGPGIAADWQVYRNDQYDFTLKYPTDWVYAEETPTGPGAKYKLKVSFWYKLGTRNNMRGVDVYVYEGSDFSLLTLTDNIVRKNPNGNPQIFNEFSDVTIGKKNYPAKEAYILNDSTFFKNTYFYAVAKDDYIYTLVPVLGKGVSSGLVYDGKREAIAHLPEFFDMLSTVDFDIPPAVADVSRLKPRAVTPRITAPMPASFVRVNGLLVCAKKNDHPGKSKQGKGRHMDMECCLDPDEYPNPHCSYSQAKYGKYL